VLESVGYFLLALLMDYLLSITSFRAVLCNPRVPADDEYEQRDEDVVQEERRVARGDADGDLVVIEGLKKV